MKATKAILLSGAALAGAGIVGASATAALVYWGVSRRWQSAGRRAPQHLRGKVVLIAGSSRGLGLAMAEEFGRLGAHLVLTARDPGELERARAQLLRGGHVEDGDRVLLIPADLRRREEAEQLIERATQHFGRVDVLVNSAGAITVGPVENQRIEDFHDAMDSNFFTGVHCTMAVLPQMLQRGSGTIVNITSVGGKVAVPHMLPYTASKFAAAGFSEGLHAELRTKGVHVLTVTPGLMRTGSHLNAQFTGDAAREYRWFSLSASLPGVAATARHAARKIVRAAIGGETEIAITPQALLASRLAHVAPGLVASAMSAVNRFLPAPAAGASEPHRGADVRQLELRPAKRCGAKAARRFNQTTV